MESTNFFLVYTSDRDSYFDQFHLPIPYFGYTFLISFGLAIFIVILSFGENFETVLENSQYEALVTTLISLQRQTTIFSDLSEAYSKAPLSFFHSSFFKPALDLNTGTAILFSSRVPEALISSLKTNSQR